MVSLTSLCYDEETKCSHMGARRSPRTSRALAVLGQVGRAHLPKAWLLLQLGCVLLKESLLPSGPPAQLYRGCWDLQL